MAARHVKRSLALVRSSRRKSTRNTATLVKWVRDPRSGEVHRPSEEVAIMGVVRIVDRTLVKVRWQTGGDCMRMREGSKNTPSVSTEISSKRRFSQRAKTEKLPAPPAGPADTQEARERVRRLSLAALAARQSSQQIPTQSGNRDQAGKSRRCPS